MRLDLMLVLLVPACAGKGNVGDPDGGTSDADTDSDSDTDTDSDADTDADTDSDTPPPLSVTIEQDVLDLVFTTDAVTIGVAYDTVVYQLNVVDGQARWPIPDICTALDAKVFTISVELDAESANDVLVPLTGRAQRSGDQIDITNLGAPAELVVVCVDDCPSCTFEQYYLNLDGTYAFRANVRMTAEIYEGDMFAPNALVAQYPAVQDVSTDIGEFTTTAAGQHGLLVTPTAEDEIYTWAIWPIP